jgi:hypothetical protein
MNHEASYYAYLAVLLVCFLGIFFDAGTLEKNQSGFPSTRRFSQILKYFKKPSGTSSSFKIQIMA